MTQNNIEQFSKRLENNELDNLKKDVQKYIESADKQEPAEVTMLKNIESLKVNSSIETKEEKEAYSALLANTTLLVLKLYSKGITANAIAAPTTFLNEVSKKIKPLSPLEQKTLYKLTDINKQKDDNVLKKYVFSSWRTSLTLIEKYKDTPTTSEDTQEQKDAQKDTGENLFKDMKLFGWDLGKFYEEHKENIAPIATGVLGGVLIWRLLSGLMGGDNKRGLGFSDLLAGAVGIPFAFQVFNSDNGFAQGLKDFWNNFGKANAAENTDPKKPDETPKASPKTTNGLDNDADTPKVVIDENKTIETLPVATHLNNIEHSFNKQVQKVEQNFKNHSFLLALAASQMPGSSALVIMKSIAAGTFTFGTSTLATLSGLTLKAGSSHPIATAALGLGAFHSLNKLQESGTPEAVKNEILAMEVPKDKEAFGKWITQEVPKNTTIRAYLEKDPQKFQSILDSLDKLATLTPEQIDVMYNVLNEKVSIANLLQQIGETPTEIFWRVGGDIARDIAFKEVFEANSSGLRQLKTTVSNIADQHREEQKANDISNDLDLLITKVESSRIFTQKDYEELKRICAKYPRITLSEVEGYIRLNFTNSENKPDYINAGLVPNSNNEITRELAQKAMSFTPFSEPRYNNMLWEGSRASYRSFLELMGNSFGLDFGVNDEKFDHSIVEGITKGDVIITMASTGAVIQKGLKVYTVPAKGVLLLSQLVTNAFSRQDRAISGIEMQDFSISYGESLAVVTVIGAANKLRKIFTNKIIDASSLDKTTAEYKNLNAFRHLSSWKGSSATSKITSIAKIAAYPISIPYDIAKKGYMLTLNSRRMGGFRNLYNYYKTLPAEKLKQVNNEMFRYKMVSKTNTTFGDARHYLSKELVTTYRAKEAFQGLLQSNNPQGLRLPIGDAKNYETKFKAFVTVISSDTNLKKNFDTYFKEQVKKSGKTPYDFALENLINKNNQEDFKHIWDFLQKTEAHQEAVLEVMELKVKLEQQRAKPDFRASSKAELDRTISDLQNLIDDQRTHPDYKDIYQGDRMFVHEYLEVILPEDVKTGKHLSLHTRKTLKKVLDFEPRGRHYFALLGGGLLLNFAKAIYENEPDMIPGDIFAKKDTSGRDASEVKTIQYQEKLAQKFEPLFSKVSDFENQISDMTAKYAQQAVLSQLDRNNIQRLSLQFEEYMTKQFIPNISRNKQSIRAFYQLHKDYLSTHKNGFLINEFVELRFDDVKVKKGQITNGEAGVHMSIIHSSALEVENKIYEYRTHMSASKAELSSVSTSMLDLTRTMLSQAGYEVSEQKLQMQYKALKPVIEALLPFFGTAVSYREMKESYARGRTIDAGLSALETTISGLGDAFLVAGAVTMVTGIGAAAGGGAGTIAKGGSLSINLLRGGTKLERVSKIQKIFEVMKTSKRLNQAEFATLGIQLSKMLISAKRSEKTVISPSGNLLKQLPKEVVPIHLRNSGPLGGGL